MTTTTRLSTVVMSTLAVVICGNTAAAQSSSALQDLHAESHAEAKPGDIQIHGHWTIDVHNPDGTVVSHNEFDNALATNGGFLLSGLLTGGYTAASWNLVAYDDYGLTTGPCQRNGAPFVCIIKPPDNEDPATPGQQQSYWFRTLSFNRVPSQSNGPLNTIEIIGDLTAAFANPIRLVESVLQFRDGNSVAGSAFTQRVLAVPIQVEPGQHVLVKVRLSFS